MESRIKRRFAEPGSFSEGAPLRTNSDSRGLNSLTGSFAVMGVVLQQPAQFFKETRAGLNLAEKIGMLSISAIVFLAVYGAVLGSGHIYLSLGAALAMPVLFLGSLVTCVPVMYLLDVLSGSQRSLGQMTAVLLASLSTAGLVFVSFTPIMMLFRLTGSLQQFFWLNIVILALATVTGLFYVSQGLIVVEGNGGELMVFSHSG